ncbi:hypothetical protein B1A_21450, partial [mine drainage metagenome]
GLAGSGDGGAHVGEDYEAQYGYRPWLIESFVDTEQFAGTCYRAANWVSVGETQGRGRQDREHKKAKSVKKHLRVSPGIGLEGPNGSCRAHRPGGARDHGRSRGRRVGEQRVWRSVIGRSATFRASGRLRPFTRGDARSRVLRGGTRRLGGDQGVLPDDRQAGRFGGDDGGDSGPSP